MKAITYTQYGAPEVLQLNEVTTPTPKKDEIRVQVFATSVNYGDIAARNFNKISPRKFNMPFLFWIFAKLFFGLRKPKIQILGSEFAGKVESTGQEVTSFKKGDPVFGFLSQSMGAYAEYFCMKENACIAIKPSNMTYEEAAVLPYGAIVALSLLKKANLQPGQNVLIIGASGGIGSAAVQIAKSHFNAKVTGVCSTKRVEFVKALGAEKVIDYSKDDFPKTGETYDLIFDVLGRSSFSHLKKSLKPNGLYLLASFKMKQLLQMLWTSIKVGKRVKCSISSGSSQELIAAKSLIEAGKIKALIDKRYPLEKAAEAHRYVEAGDKKGHIVITLTHNNEAE